MTYVIVAYWRPREGQAEKIEAILRDLAAAARQEPGNLEFIVNRSHDDPNEFLLYEQYKDGCERVIIPAWPPDRYRRDR